MQKTIEELDEVIERLALNAEMGAVGQFMRENAMQNESNPDRLAEVRKQVIITQHDSKFEANYKAIQEVLATATVRDSTRYLLEAIYLDTKPRDAAVVDFGIESAQHLYALAVPVLKGEITPQQLDQAVGNGAMLTRLAREAPSSVDNHITFDMPWHGLLRVQLPAERESAFGKMSLEELKRNGNGQQNGRPKSRERGMGR